MWESPADPDSIMRNELIVQQDGGDFVLTLCSSQAGSCAPTNGASMVMATLDADNPLTQRFRFAAA